MTGTLRLNRIAPLVLAALAIAAVAASVRLAPLVAPAFPLIGQPSNLTAPEGSVPAQLPASDVVAPTSDPAMGPVTDSTPFAAPQAPANAPSYESPTTAAPGAGSSPTTIGSGAPASGYRTAPSRWSEWPNDTPPANLAPSQTTTKRPPPGNSP